MINHLQSIFREDIDTTDELMPSVYDIDGGTILAQLQPKDFHEAIIRDGHKVATRKNIHRHSYTCKKYGST